VSFTTLLVANRGEIARRVIRSARDMGLRCVAVYVDADADAPFVGDADEAVRIPTSYLDGEALLAAAQATGAEAIHPGYGFLSENADFANNVIAAGISWVGPSPEAIARMGDKIAARALAEEAGVAVVPGAQDASDAGAVGYPLLVKAAAGGGGKGMRIVTAPEGLEEAVAAARREARGAFGDDRVFIERYVARARHVEVQVLGDTHGGLVHLGERECSVQRRHQKILEESPSPRVDPALREAMGEAALRLARKLDYRSAGTVEFLLDDDSGDFYFLEVNTRLQVEHPVTELVTGIDLVREQLRIAAGEALGYRQQDLRFDGHAIEARLYAEDPANGFLPATGRLEAFVPAGTPRVRWDCGVIAGSRVGTDFDPMLGKVIAHAPTRRESAGRLALALERTHIAGLTTNRDFLVQTLRSPHFLAGDTTTDFIERTAVPHARLPDDALRTRLARLAALWVQGRNRQQARVLGLAPSGWRNARLPAQKLVLDHGETCLTLRYRARRDGTFHFVADGDSAADEALARIHAWEEDAIDAEIDGRRTRARITRTADEIVVHGPHGDLGFRVQPRFVVPGEDEEADGATAQMPGKVLEVRVAVGERVSAGDTLVVLEAMKMEHPMRAAEDGIVVEVHVAPGDQVEAGMRLLLVEPEGDDDASAQG